MTVEQIRLSPEWLDLREAADAAARDRRPRRAAPAAPPGDAHAGDPRPRAAAPGRWAAGSRRCLRGGSVGSCTIVTATCWTSPQPTFPAPAADGASVEVETRQSDITQLLPDDLADATLITASALLDLMTGDALAGLIDVCSDVGCPVLLTLSVVGRVELDPMEPLDSRVAAAFDAHQRRMTVDGRLLGPDAAAAAAEGFRRRGAEVLVRPSPWRLGADAAGLAAEWLSGWLAAAFEQDAELAVEAETYGSRRLTQARAGQLAVTVDHADLLVVP